MEKNRKTQSGTKPGQAHCQKNHQMTALKATAGLTLLILIAVIAATLAATTPAMACGGFFCQNTPVDQNAERIIFAQGKDGILDTYIQIQYTGSAPDFSWILPVPIPITGENLSVPEDAMAAFNEIERLTDPVLIPPMPPQCFIEQMEAFSATMAMDSSKSVTVYDTGEVGPYSFDIIGSENPDELITWLRDNKYQVTEPMEPLIEAYVQEEFAFLAMRLLPQSGAEDVDPIRLTYPSTTPMIPLRLTAVAANPNMAVKVWVYAAEPAKTLNYAEARVADEEIQFLPPWGNDNYRQVMQNKADRHGGLAFFTEYAGPSANLNPAHPLLRELGQEHRYVTRLETIISPEEMTLDPIFGYDPSQPDVSNVRDLTRMPNLFGCTDTGDKVSTGIRENPRVLPNEVLPPEMMPTEAFPPALLPPVLPPNLQQEPQQESPVPAANTQPGLNPAGVKPDNGTTPGNRQENTAEETNPKPQQRPVEPAEPNTQEQPVPQLTPEPTESSLLTRKGKYLLALAGTLAAVLSASLAGSWLIYRNRKKAEKQGQAQEEEKNNDQGEET